MEKKQYVTPRAEMVETGLAGAMIAASAREVQSQQVETAVWEDLDEN